MTIERPTFPPRFETLKDAENALMEQGFKLVPDTCNWIDADGNDAGAYPVEEAYGVSKYRIEYRRQVFPVAPTRRRFLSGVAGVAAGGTALALATISATADAAAPVASLASSDVDPIFALLEDHRKLQAAWLGLCRELEDAEYEAEKEHGQRPIALIHWRGYPYRRVGTGGPARTTAA